MRREWGWRSTDVWVLLALGLLACSGGETGPATTSGSGGSVATTVGQGGDWAERDECADESHQCDANATCEDTSSFYACTCKSGFEGDGVSCIEVDECGLALDDCSPYADCLNTEGSYSCTCQAGFVGDGKACRSSYTQLSVGHIHNCAVRADGQATCWGSNRKSDGQVLYMMLGTDWETDQSRPIVVPTGEWAEVRAGFLTSCGRKTDGSVWCWGAKLGATGGVTYLPQRLGDPGDPGTSTYQRLAEGEGFHTCAIRADDSLWCWGKNNLGQLGVNNQPDSQSPVAVSVGAALKVATVAVGYWHTCAIATEGSLWCWGQGLYGQLGTGLQTQQDIPTQVGTDENWASIALGQSHSCARKTGGQLWCWGRNDKGQLGDGTTVQRLIPVAIDAANTYQAVVAGSKNTCGLREPDGTLWCWGSGEGGQLGPDGNGSATPVQIGAEAGWTGIGVGHGHGCGMRGDEIQCWGSSLYSATGVGVSGKRASPRALTHGPVSAISTGKKHACSVGQDGSLWCWGDNRDGQLGDGNSVSQREAVEVSGGDKDWIAVATGDDFSNISYVEYHTCGIRSAGTAGTLWCWGANSYNQLGYDTAKVNNKFSDQLTPQQVGTDATWTSVTAGSIYTCGLKADQSLWCWGRGDLGQLGLGANTWGKTPTKVGSGIYIQVSARASSTLAIDSSGKLWAWGKNTEGQLGQGGTSAKVTVPTQIGNDTDWAHVSSGGLHSCAVKTGEELYCWGSETYGKLGFTAAGGKQLVPAQVQGSGWITVTAGRVESSCGLKKDANSGHTLWCWGGNAWGQLGVGDYEPSVAPVQVGVATNWAGVHVGQRYVCGYRESGEPSCWGSTAHGRTGLGDAWNDGPERLFEP